MSVMKKIKNLIDFDYALFRKEIYRKHCSRCDKWGTDDPKYHFEYDIVISKCYTLRGIVWEIKVPNMTAHDKNLYRLVVETIEYASTKFPSYFRLEDELFKKDLYRSLG